MSQPTFERVAPPLKGEGWRGKMVRSRYALANSYYKFSPGTVFTIDNEPSVNKNLTSTPCPCCGLSGRITIKASRVNFLMDFEFVEQVAP